MKGRSLLAFIIICSITLNFSGYKVFAESPWPMLMHDARHTGRSEYTIADQVSFIWNSKFASNSTTGLAISPDGNTIYAGSKDHYIYAINLSDGTVKWKYLTDHEVVDSPAISKDGNIYIGSKDDYLYCLNSSGELNWRAQLDSDIKSSPVISSLDMVLITTNQRLYAFSLNGISQWNYSVGNPLTPAIGNDGTVYLAGGGDLYAINSDGSLQWTVDLQQTEFSSLTIGDDGTIYCAEGHKYPTNSGSLYAISTDGSVLWSYTLGDMPYLSNPATGPDGTIYIGCDDYYLYAINPDGTLKWRYLAAETMIYSSFAIDKNGIILTKLANYNLAINSDGTLKWQIVYQDFISTMPVIGKNGVIFTGTSHGIAALTGGGQTSYNLTGIWTYTETSVWDNCPDSESAGSGTATVTQSGTNIEMVIDDVTYTGIINDSTCNLTAIIGENYGFTRRNIVITLSSETFGTGSSNWVWTGTVTCEGSSIFTFSKQTGSNDNSSGNGDSGDCFINTTAYGF